ncbi:MAG: SusC/RagA family TonB-linked outer membrane protein [Breznakibacter sp.]
MKRIKKIHKISGGFPLKFTRALLGFFLLTVSAVSMGQNEAKLMISGTVRDANTRLPIPAALVRSLAYDASVTTDSTGTFKIELYSGTDVVVITAFDYAAREVAVKDRQSVTVDMYPEFFKPSYRHIEGLTGKVNVNQTSISSSAIGGFKTVNSVTADEQMNALNGAGLRSIGRSGYYGIGSSYFIRGFNSVNTNAQPLFVVDGVIWSNFFDVQSLHNGYYGNSLADIDPVDIESVTVIKDGTSIYGSKGANGVVIIKTKRGTGMATKITANMYTGVTTQPKSIPMMDGEEMRIYATDLYGSLNYTNEQFEALPFLNQDQNSSIYKIYHNKTDWNDRVYQNSFSKGINVAVDGGDERALYAFSFGYGDNEGLVKGNDLQRLNMRFNADFNMTKVFTTALSLGFANVDRSLMDDGVSYYSSPGYLAMIKAPFFSPYKYTAAGGWSKSFADYDGFGVTNPDGLIDYALNKNQHYRLSIGVKPTVWLTPYLTISSLFNYELDKVKENYFSPVRAVAPRYLAGLGYSYNYAQNQVMRNIALFDDTQLSYKRTFNKTHSVDAMLGWRYSTSYYELDFVEGHNSMSNDKPNVKDHPDFRSVYGINDRVKSISNYASVGYNYYNRYFVNASVAMDASSLFGSDTKDGFRLFDQTWGVFPAVNAAWVLSSERFMSNAGFVDHLKVKVGYGITGNDGIKPFANTPYFVTELVPSTRIVAIVLGNIANDQVQWETTAKLNAGLDLNLFNERLALSADFYQSNTRNLLMLRDLPVVAGKGKYWTNDGELSNKGMEITAQVKVLNASKLKWEMGASAGKYENRIEKLNGGSYTTDAYGAQILTAEGHAAGVFYGYKTKGVLTTGAAANAANLKMQNDNGTYTYFAPGDMLFDDYKADGIIDENDRQVIGDPNPDFYGSFNSKWSYRNFTLDALFTFSYGNDVYNYLRAKLESGSELINQTTAMLNRWKYEGQATDMPRAMYGDPVGNARFSDRWIEDGSYLKLKSVSLNYKVPYQGAMISGIDVWVSANNLLTFSKYLGRDPEVSVSNSVLLQGIDIGLLPQTPGFFVGVKLSL